MSSIPISMWLVMRNGAYRGMLVSALERLNCTVEPMLAAEAVVSRLNHSMPDAIVVSVDLPGMRIFEAARWVRGARNGENVALYALAASRHEEREAEGTNVDAVVRTPFNPASLAREIRLRLDVDREMRALRSMREYFGNRQLR